MIKTPRKAVSFGTDSGNPIPHVHFIINNDGCLPQIQAQILQTLLFFHLHVNPQFCWSWEIIPSTRTPKIYNLNVESLDLLRKDLSQENRAGDSYSVSSCSMRDPYYSPSSASQMKLLIRAIEHALVKVNWSATPVVASQTPLRKVDLNYPTAPKIRHFIFVASRMCKNLKELKEWTCSQLEDKILENVFCEFISKELWAEAAGKRVCISWLDTNEVMLF